MAFFKTLYEKLAGEKNPSHSKSRREKNIILRLFENIKNIKKKWFKLFFSKYSWIPIPVREGSWNVFCRLDMSIYNGNICTFLFIQCREGRGAQRFITMLKPNKNSPKYVLLLYDTIIYVYVEMTINNTCFIKFML